MVARGGFEPSTTRVWTVRSSQLSYAAILKYIFKKFIFTILQMESKNRSRSYGMSYFHRTIANIFWSSNSLWKFRFLKNLRCAFPLQWRIVWKSGFPLLRKYSLHLGHAEVICFFSYKNASFQVFRRTHSPQKPTIQERMNQDRIFATLGGTPMQIRPFLKSILIIADKKSFVKGYEWANLKKYAYTLECPKRSEQKIRHDGSKCGILRL